jgi:ssDNA-binding Zn-finger/Zn-ribbon topoisomerase 1
MAGMMIQKERRKSRSSNDVMGNRFPTGRYDEKNKRASKDALVE